MAEGLPKWFKIIIALVAFSFSLYFLSLIAPLVKLFVISLILAYVLNPVVTYFESRGLGRTLSTSVIFFCIILFLTLFVFLLLPNFSKELQSMQSNMKSGQTSVAIAKLEADLVSKLSFLGIEKLNVIGQLEKSMAEIGEGIFNYIIDAVSLITNLILIPFFIFFLLKDGRTFTHHFIKLVPNRYFEFFINLKSKTDDQLGNYVRGQFAESLIVGVLVIIAMFILDIKYAFVIGLFVGLTNLIPYIGPLIGAVPAILVAFFDSGDVNQAIYVAIALLIVQVLDNLILKPIVVAKSVDMHPMTVLLVVIIGGQFFGVLGMLLSVPLTAIIQLVVKESVVAFGKYRLV